MKKLFLLISSILTGMLAGAGIVKKIDGKLIEEAKDMSDKHLSLFLMMNEWVKIKQNGKNLLDYFVRNNYNRIAIYGMSYVGETLLKELSGSEVEVVYGIDKNAEIIDQEFKVITMENPLEEGDVIVVTAITFYDEIEEKLSKKIDCPIISLEDILYEI